MLTQNIMPRFSETDALGHINNNTYGIWFEAAREPIYKLFLPNLNIKKWCLVMAHSSNDFLKEVFWGEEVIVKTAVSKIGNSSFELKHAVYQKGVLCTSSKTVLIHYDFDSKIAIKIPDNIKAKLEEHIFTDSWDLKI
ncbi:acyl-CoA thioesterase [Aliarcobacter butzleri]|uniref:acyl-CoA thioesterase n=1 Tax=Aliarcobacter butzleri TaxID=28197 RepID=UPI003450D884